MIFRRGLASTERALPRRWLARAYALVTRLSLGRPRRAACSECRPSSPTVTRSGAMTGSFCWRPCSRERQCLAGDLGEQRRRHIKAASGANGRQGLMTTLRPGHAFGLLAQAAQHVGGSERNERPAGQGGDPYKIDANPRDAGSSVAILLDRPP